MSTGRTRPAGVLVAAKLRQEIHPASKRGAPAVAVKPRLGGQDVGGDRGQGGPAVHGAPMSRSSSAIPWARAGEERIAVRACGQTVVMVSLGYDPAFLATSDVPEIGPPSALLEGEPDAGSVPDALDYTHFTVRMHPVRRLAWWVAWNVDGLTLFPSDSISRSGERFKLDPRLPAGAQTGEEVYADNDLDRGRLARRSDLLWGATLAEALDANSDSFYFTNICPQRAGFNQSGRGGVWGLLENAVLALDGLEDRRLSVFAGPVLAAADPTYRGVVQLPREFWKIVAYRVDGQLRFKAFLLTQSLDGIELVTSEPDAFLNDFDTYLVPIDLLEGRTSLAFTSLRAAVPDEEGLRASGPVLVTAADDVPW